MFIRKLLIPIMLTISAAANAGVISGGSTLVNNVGLSQLETWLGQGELTLTNIFTKTEGSTSYDFHRAADGKGATFSLMSASEDGGATWKTIGGYNPVSWDSFSAWRYAYNLSDRTAFIFNLTDGVKKQQSEQAQTYNYSYYGPTFGGGHDIYVNTSLNLGYSYGYSYSPDYYAKSIVNDTAYNGMDMKIGALEVFSISEFVPTDANVPEPSTMAIFALGLLGCCAATRRRKGTLPGAR